MTVGAMTSNNAVIATAPLMSSGPNHPVEASSVTGNDRFASPAAELSSLIERTQVSPKVRWANVGDPAVAAMTFWAGRPLIDSEDPVAVAVGLEWVTAAWREAGLPVYAYDVAMLDGAKRLGPPTGAADDWLMSLLVAAAHAALDSVGRNFPADRPDLRRWAIADTGASLVRCRNLLASPPSRALLALLRLREGLTVAQAAERGGMTTRQWSHAEAHLTADLDPDALAGVADGFGEDSTILLNAIGTRRPVSVTSRHIPICVHGDNCNPLALGDSLWYYDRSAVPVWLAPGASVASCPEPECPRRLAIGTLGVYLCEATFGGGPRASARALARYLS